MSRQATSGSTTQNSSPLNRLLRIYAQAALGLALQEIQSSRGDPFSAPPVTAAGFGSGYQQKEFNLVEIPADGKGDSTSTSVKVRQTAPSKFDITVGDAEYLDVVSTLDNSNGLTTFYPHTRLNTTFIRDEDRLTLFQQGKQYRLQLATPKWAEKALGIKDVTNSVLAPMPCKVLRVEVSEGDTVTKDQPLVVIESMKMETVIRSPHDGVIAKVVHGKGVSRIARTSVEAYRTDLTFRIFAKRERRWSSLWRRRSSCMTDIERKHFEPLITIAV
jgi:3-methylcrotonyl-CoA carboxylase alpha subunit